MQNTSFNLNGKTLAELTRPHSCSSTCGSAVHALAFSALAAELAHAHSAHGYTLAELDIQLDGRAITSSACANFVYQLDNNTQLTAKYVMRLAADGGYKLVALGQVKVMEYVHGEDDSSSWLTDAAHPAIRFQVDTALTFAGLAAEMHEQLNGAKAFVAKAQEDARAARKQRTRVSVEIAF